MNFKIKILVLLALKVILIESFNKYNVSIEQLHQCKVYIIRGTGYVYKDFFNIETLNKTQLANDERLHLKFYVMTDMDAHVLLTVNSSPLLIDRVYEIVIGAGGNTFSAIRSHMGRRRITTNTNDQYLLSVFEATPIEIIQKTNGTLSIFIPGLKKEPILTYDDPDPLNINYVSFSSFRSSIAQWFYDCKFDGFEGEIEEVPKYLSDQQKLLLNLTKNNMFQSRPSEVRDIGFGFEVTSIFYDQRKSILITRLNLHLFWHDPRLQWNRKDFHNLSTLINPDLMFWKPDLNVINGAFETYHSFKPKYEVYVNSTGDIELLGQNIEMKTWCLNEMRNWPSEQFKCRVFLNLKGLSDNHFNPINLKFDNRVPISHEPINLLSEWMFSLITLKEDRPVIQTPYDYCISLEITRNSTFYKDVFTFPIFACHILFMLSFFLNGYRRGAVILLVFITTSINLLFMTKHAPRNYTPNLMYHYQNAMWICVCLYVLHIVLIWCEKCPPRFKPPQITFSLLTISPIRRLLCLNVTNSTDYAEIVEHPWKEIGKVLNNLTFIIVNIFLLIENFTLLP